MNDEEKIMVGNCIRGEKKNVGIVNHKVCVKINYS